MKISALRWPAAIAAVLVLPSCGLESYTLQMLTLAGIYATAALGLNLVLGQAGQISLGQAAFFGVGAYVTAQIMLKTGLPFPLGLTLGGLAAGVLGAGLGYLALRFHGHFLAMVTLCFGVIMQIMFVQLPALTGGAAGLSDIPGPYLAGQPLDNDSGTWFKTFHLAWLLFLAAAWFLSNLAPLRSGRAWAALRDDALAAEASGLSVASLKVQAFTIGAVLAGLAGGVYAVHTHYVGPELFGVGTSLEFLIMVVVGGLGNAMGALTGALLLTLAPEILRSYEEYRLLGFSLLLMIIVLVAPGGIWGLLAGLARRTTQLKARAGSGPA